MASGKIVQVYTDQILGTLFGCAAHCYPSLTIFYSVMPHVDNNIQSAEVDEYSTSFLKQPNMVVCPLLKPRRSGWLAALVMCPAADSHPMRLLVLYVLKC